jgi:hypothetical protein
VADSRQFGTPKAFGDKAGDNPPGDTGRCAQCQAMLADALDGTLSAADLESFDLHMAHCGPCSQLLADARRGAAWLEMLRTPAPEPPAALLERILAQTTGESLPVLTGVSVPAPAFGGVAPGYAPVHGSVVPFRRRVVAFLRAGSFGQIILQPRLVMTAAMAFFSIALTMDLTGVRPQELKISDLSPSSLRRDYYWANTRVVQYYESLRVVYELESRVRDMESISGDDAPAGGQGQPPAGPSVPSPVAQPSPGQPTPASPNLKAAPHSGAQPARRKPAPHPGTSRRQDFNQSPRNRVACTGDDANLRRLPHVYPAGGLA